MLSSLLEEIGMLRKKMTTNSRGYALAMSSDQAGEETRNERDAYIARVLNSYRASLTHYAHYQLGYPAVPFNPAFDYGPLNQLHNFHLNNAGDPFTDANYSCHSRQFEVGVLDWFARLWELGEEDYWGYVTNGGTEGNMHGILLGREIFPDGILYASNDSHYSIFKIGRMLRMEVVKVETLTSGGIDCVDLRSRLVKNKEKPAIINVNIGTTMKGAVDDLDLVIETLEEAGFKDRFYIHCDAALFGMMLPFVTRGVLTFKKAIGSVSISGHKFLGCPTPCGVQITRKEHVKVLSGDVEYIGSKDATVTGSRNGHAPILLWFALRSRLRAAGIGAMRNELSSTVVLERPRDEGFVRKWQLACQGGISHVVVMPGVDIAKLDEFLEEIVRRRAAWYPRGKAQTPCIAADVGTHNCACAEHDH